jgi:hypothetical protein
MTGWETLNCENHPERIALERCEVCRKPLCAYCLYYTDDGQRLCAEHAEDARLFGARIQDPGTYAEQLIGAQIGAVRKESRSRSLNDPSLYHGNSNDLMALLGALLSLLGLGACVGVIYCLPLGGLALSLAALLNAKKAFDPKRTRRLALGGLLVSGVWVLVVGGCILTYGRSLSDATGGQWCNLGGVYVFSPGGGGGGGSNATNTPVPTPTIPDRVTLTPTPTSTDTPVPTSQ